MEITAVLLGDFLVAGPAGNRGGPVLTGHVAVQVLDVFMAAPATVAAVDRRIKGRLELLIVMAPLAGPANGRMGSIIKSAERKGDHQEQDFSHSISRFHKPYFPCLFSLCGVPGVHAAKEAGYIAKPLLEKVTCGQKSAKPLIVDNQDGTVLRKFSVSSVELVHGYVDSIGQMVPGKDCLGADIQDQGIPVLAAPAFVFKGLDRLDRNPDDALHGLQGISCRLPGWHSPFQDVNVGHPFAKSHFSRLTAADARFRLTVQNDFPFPPHFGQAALEFLTGDAQ